MSLWQRIKTQERNPPKCSCQRDERGHAVVTKNRGTKYVEGTEHQANHGDPFTHRKGCPHSELQLTTKPNEYLAASEKFAQIAKLKHENRASRARRKRERKEAHKQELAKMSTRIHIESTDGLDRGSPAAPSETAAQPVVSS